jgi:hypothetical protein
MDSFAKQLANIELMLKNERNPYKRHKIFRVLEETIQLMMEVGQHD